MHPWATTNTQQAQPAAAATGQAGQAYTYGTQINQGAPWQQAAPSAPTGPYAQAYAAAQPGYVQQPLAAAQAQGSAAAAPWQNPAGAASQPQPWATQQPAATPAPWPVQQQQYPTAAAGYPGQQYPRTWVGTVTQLIPPNYGIVDGDTFYVEQQVIGRVPKVGDKVNCEAIPNTDGGQYKWRMTKLQALDAQGAAPGTSTAAALAAAQAQARAIAASHVASRTASMQRSTSTQPPVVSRPGVSSPMAAPAPTPAHGAAPAAAPTERKYNNAPPPTAAYTADMALAAVSSMMDSSREAGTTANGSAPVKAPYSRPPPQLTDADRQRAQVTVQQYSQFGKGAELLSKMGFGMKGPGLGAHGQGIAAPVDPKSTRAGMGLGFEGTAPAARTGGPRDRPREGGERPREGYRDRGRLRSRSPRGSSSSSRSSSSSSRSSSVSSRSRSRTRSPSPLRRHVAIPPHMPVGVEQFRGTASMTRRYKNMYVPSEFSHLTCSWIDSSWASQPASSLLTYPLVFNISPNPAGTTTANSDTNHADKQNAGACAQTVLGRSSSRDARDCRWSVRVALCAGMPASTLHSSTTHSFQHPVAALSFLTCHNRGSSTANKDTAHSENGDKPADTKSIAGGQGKVCGQPVWPQFLPGGSWEPCDGPDPSQEPGVLVKTAIRCVKEATGVDLSSCRQFINMGEVKYLRETSSKQPATAALSDVVEERTVLFLVDAWSAASPNTAAAKAHADAKALIAAEEAASKALSAAEEDLKTAEKALAACAKGGGGKDSRSSDTTLDASKLTVAQLQEELSKRGLDTKWDPLKGKKQLQDRLQAYLDQKRAEFAQVDEELRKELEAKAAVAQAKQHVTAARSSYDAAHAAAKPAKDVLRKYMPPLCIRAWPGPVAAAAGVGLAVTSLQDMLDYRESSKTQGEFELQAFAEVFLEMLTVQFGRALLRALPVVLGGKPQGTSSTKGTGERELIAAAEGDKAIVRAASTAATGADRKEPVNATNTAAGSGEGAAIVNSDQQVQQDVAMATTTHAEQGSAAASETAAADVQMSDGVVHVADASAGKKRGAGPAVNGAALASKRVKPDISVQGESLLLCCRFFDTRCTGYLAKDDLEEILYMTCSTATRRQVQALVDSVAKRGRFSYTEHPGVHAPPSPTLTAHRALPACATSSGPDNKQLNTEHAPHSNELKIEDPSQPSTLGMGLARLLERNSFSTAA